VRADLMDAIDRFLRIHRGQQNVPFGGIQLILFGDPYQLPPVVSAKAEREYLDDHYASPHFFSSHVFAAHPLECHELTKVFRQSDAAFVDALNGIRTGDHSIDHIRLINQRHIPTFQTRTGDGFFILTTTNAAAAAENTQKLAQLPGPERQYEAAVTGKFNNDRNDDRDNDRLPAELFLTLRVGAQVMFNRNDSNRRWVNGTIGWVRDLTDESIEVEIAGDRGGGRCAVQRETWEQIRYEYDREEQRVEAEIVGTFTQFPLRLGWAITIHKGQGQTFDKAVIDFGSGTFVSGHAYVALSRCRTLDGIVLRRRLRDADIKVDAEVKRFMSGIGIVPWAKPAC
jgi:ATP-dependent DNA helicase PIF1